MKKLFLALALLFLPSAAWGQCTGVFQSGQFCGNFTTAAAPPTAFPPPSRSPQFISASAGGGWPVNDPNSSFEYLGPLLPIVLFAEPANGSFVANKLIRDYHPPAHSSVGISSVGIEGRYQGSGGVGECCSDIALSVSGFKNAFGHSPSTATGGGVEGLNVWVRQDSQTTGTENSDAVGVLANVAGYINNAASNGWGYLFAYEGATQVFRADTAATLWYVRTQIGVVNSGYPTLSVSNAIGFLIDLFNVNNTGSNFGILIRNNGSAAFDIPFAYQLAGGSVPFSVDTNGKVTAAGYNQGASAGVTCSGTPTASFASSLGIVTHC